jgi:hypothetical protein
MNTFNRLMTLSLLITVFFLGYLIGTNSSMEVMVRSPSVSSPRVFYAEDSDLFLIGPYKEFTDSLTGNGATISYMVDDFVEHSYNSWHLKINTPSEDFLKLLDEFMRAYNECRRLDPTWMREYSCWRY